MCVSMYMICYLGDKDLLPSAYEEAPTVEGA